MKERPILFSAPMVRAILDGRKMQTRRALKPQPAGGLQHGVIGPLNGDGRLLACRFGQPGDRLWVRETFGLQVRNYGGGYGEHIVYRATNPDAIYCRSACGKESPVRWKPSIHMRRHSSRITLEVTGVRVERLQQCSESDAEAEGIVRFKPADRDGRRHFGLAGDEGDGEPTAVHAYQKLWDRINGPGSWEANPWVWVVEFKRVAP